MANKSCLGASAQVNTDQSIAALTNSRDLAAAELSLQTFLDQYHIKALVLPSTWPTTFYRDNLDDNDLPGLIEFGKLLICEYAKYSQLWVHTSQIRQVAFVKNLRLNPSDASCHVLGLTNFATLTVYHSAECSSKLPTPSLKHAIQHEFYHLIAYSVGDYEDPAWLAFNDPGFSYGKQNWPVTGSLIHVDHPRPGFVSTYAMTSEQEDQAETYAALFVAEEYRDVMAWIATDATLKMKVGYLKLLILNYDPAMNVYFEKAAL